MRINTRALEAVQANAEYEVLQEVVMNKRDHILRPYISNTVQQTNAEQWLLSNEALLLKNKKNQRTKYKQRKRSEDLDGNGC